MLSASKSLIVTASFLSILAAQTAADDVVNLKGGDVLHGTIVEANEANLVLEHAQLGRLTIDRGTVVSFIYETPPPAGDAEEAAPPAAEAPVEEEPVKWKSRLELGFNGSEGRTENANARILFRTERETEDTRLKLDATYFVASSDGDRTQNKFDAGAKHDWLFTDSPWYAFILGRYELDEFARYDHRVSGAGGFGYDWIKTDETDFRIEFGGGASHEFGGPQEDTIPEGYFAANLRHDLTDAQTVYAGFEIYPSFDEFGDYRAIARAEWEMAIDHADGVSLKFGVNHEFESKDEGSQEDLTTYYGTLVFEF